MTVDVVELDVLVFRLAVVVGVGKEGFDRAVTEDEGGIVAENEAGAELGGIGGTVGAVDDG